MKRGIVTAVHPEDHSVDIVLSDGRRLTGIQVMTPNGSTRSGIFDMPAVPAKKDKWDITTETGQDQIALVDEMDGLPVVVGFLFPQINQMTFDDAQRRITRHQSDVLTSIDASGNIQIQHPSGFFIRIAETTTLENLTGKNSDKNLKLDKNTTKAINLHVQTKNGTASFTVSAAGGISMNAAQSVSITAPSVDISASTGISLTTPRVSVSGDVIVAGDVKAGGISLRTHTHGGVKSGPDSSGGPN